MQVENEDDRHLLVYKKFFENFVEEMDQLPVKVAGYQILETELIGEMVDWTYQYLQQKECPPTLFVPLCRQVVDEMLYACKKQPLSYGYRENIHVFPPLKLMQAVTNKVSEICKRYSDPNRLSSLPKIQRTMAWATAIKNSRRLMEDRHVIIEDFHGLFNIQDPSPASFYAVFDGHAGTDAATYANNHLHQFLAESSFYPNNPKDALQDAFLKTDELFLNKSNIENLRSGTTALCTLLRRKEQMLYVAWSGDSQAILIRQEEIIRLVNPHKPDRQDENERITSMGGCVLHWGTWRVNGQLAVSRAIGDPEYKPYVTAEPDILALPLDGSEHFLILACDGLWDFVNEKDVARAVYQEIITNPDDDLSVLSSRLVQISKAQGSPDNITVIVALLADPQCIIQSYKSRLETANINFVVNDSWTSPTDNNINYESAQAVLLEMDASTSAASATAAAANNNPFLKGALMMDSSSLFNSSQNGTSPNSSTTTTASELFFLNGKQTISGDLDFGPETDVDATDELATGNHHPNDVDNEIMMNTSNNILLPNKQQQILDDLQADLELQRQQMSDFDPIQAPRDETPTPPADEVPKSSLCGLSEPDNVAAESGDDSEDEWNYFRVEQKLGDSSNTTVTESTNNTANITTTTSTIDETITNVIEPEKGEEKAASTEILDKSLTICEENNEELDTTQIKSNPLENIVRPNFLPESLTFTEQEHQEEDDMTSQLNPNAAEFIPSPTHGSRGTFEQLLLLNGSGSSCLDESDVSSTRAEFGDTSQASVGQFFGNLDPLETFEQPRVEHAELVNLGPTDVVSPLGSIPEAASVQQPFSEEDETMLAPSELVASNLMEPLTLSTTRQDMETSSIDLLSPSSMEPKSPLPELVKLMDNTSDLNIRPSESPLPTINENSLNLLENEKLLKSPSLTSPIGSSTSPCDEQFSSEEPNQVEQSPDLLNIEQSKLLEKSPMTPIPTILSPPKSPMNDSPIPLSPVPKINDIHQEIEKEFISTELPIIEKKAELELRSKTPLEEDECPVSFEMNSKTPLESYSPLSTDNKLLLEPSFDDQLSPKIEMDNDIMTKSTLFDGPIRDDTLEIDNETKTILEVEGFSLNVNDEHKSPILTGEPDILKISSPTSQDTVTYPKSPLPEEGIPISANIEPILSVPENKSPIEGDSPITSPIQTESISSPVPADSPKLSMEAEMPVSSIPFELPTSSLLTNSIPSEISTIIDSKPLTCSLPKDALPTSKEEMQLKEEKSESIKIEPIVSVKIEKEKKPVAAGTKKPTSTLSTSKKPATSTVSKISTTSTKTAPRMSNTKTLSSTTTTKTLTSKSAPTKSQPTSPTKPMSVKTTTTTTATTSSRKPLTSRTTTTTTSRTSTVMNRTRPTPSLQAQVKSTTTTNTKVSAPKSTTRPVSATTKITTTTTKSNVNRPASATATLKSRPSLPNSNATITKKTILNGDSKTTTATTKQRTPIASRTTTTSTTTTTTSRPLKPKTTEISKGKPILDKQVKETVNKQLTTARPRTALTSSNTTKRVSTGGTTTRTTKTTVANGKMMKKTTMTTTTINVDTTKSTNDTTTANGIDDLQSICEQNGNKTEENVTVEQLLDNAVHLIPN